MYPSVQGTQRYVWIWVAPPCLPPTLSYSLKFILSDPVQLCCHLHTNGCFLAGRSLLHYGSGMVDPDLQNVTAGGCNGVIRLSSVDTTMLKNDSMTYFLPKLSSSHFCLLVLVLVFLFLSQKIPEKRRQSPGRQWAQCSMKNRFHRARAHLVFAVDRIHFQTM